MSDYFVCPVCGTDVDVNAVVCPECGSDDETGWSEDTAYDGLYLYGDDENDETARRSAKSRPWIKYLISLIIVITLSAFLATAVTWGIYLVPVILLAAGLAYYLMEIAPKRQSSREKMLYQTLLTRARGDHALVERWISYERTRDPDADEYRLMEAAFYRWERDNR
jgi:RNA polymerase subunit RPABC4/transcription elongation factor Spt4